MVAVRVWGSLREATGGRDLVYVEGETFKAVLDALVKAHPALQPVFDKGVSMAIDGLIVNDTWATPIRPDSEVTLMPYMKGG